jgi:hypothetical protein
MGLLIKARSFVAERRWSAWQDLTYRPREIQNRLLIDIIRRNRATLFGRDHRFDTIGSLTDYRRQVQIGDYERLRPYVERAANGEVNALTREPVLMFTLTSGSTANPKLIPITESARKNHRLLTRLWYHRASVDHPRCFGGKLLGIVSPVAEGKTPGGIAVGAASGLIYESSPRWIRNAFVTPHAVSEIKDFDAKYYVIMRLALEHEVSFLATPNPSTILKLLESADGFKDEIIKDVRDGAIAGRWNLPVLVRDQLLSGLAKNRGRARQLEKFATEQGKLRPREYWPGLQLIGCWKGGTVGTRLKEFGRWFAEGTPVRDLGYMASEAQITLPVSDAGSAGVLAIDANFYEFIPDEEIGSAHPTALTCAELDEGKTYYIVLTTPAGLYRYDINDVVRVTGFYNRTPLIEFVRKGRDVTNITGEKVHVNQVIQAMEQAQSAARVTVQHYRAFADTEKSRYAFLVEMDGAVASKVALSSLLEELDSSLRRLNIEYEQKRTSLRLRAPVLWLMKPGWFERRASSMLQRVAADVQFKAQLLSAVSEDVSEALLIVEKTDAAAASEEPT